MASSIVDKTQERIEEPQVLDKEGLTSINFDANRLELKLIEVRNSKPKVENGIEKASVEVIWIEFHYNVGTSDEAKYIPVKIYMKDIMSEGYARLVKDGIVYESFRMLLEDENNLALIEEIDQRILNLLFDNKKLFPAKALTIKQKQNVASLRENYTALKHEAYDSEGNKVDNYVPRFFAAMNRNQYYKSKIVMPTIGQVTGKDGLTHEDVVAAEVAWDKMLRMKCLTHTRVHLSYMTCVQDKLRVKVSMIKSVIISEPEPMAEEDDEVVQEYGTANLEKVKEFTELFKRMNMGVDSVETVAPSQDPNAFKAVDDATKEAALAKNLVAKSKTLQDNYYDDAIGDDNLDEPVSPEPVKVVRRAPVKRQI